MLSGREQDSGIFIIGMVCVTVLLLAAMLVFTPTKEEVEATAFLQQFEENFDGEQFRINMCFGTLKSAYWEDWPGDEEFTRLNPALMAWILTNESDNPGIVPGFYLTQEEKDNATPRNK